MTVERPLPVLETARLRLRPTRPDDADALHSSLADAELMRWWSHAPHQSIEETQTKLASAASGWRRWIVTVRDDDRAIGFVAAGEKRQGNVSEIGYLLARAHWGTGIAREAIGAVLDQLFRVEGQRKAAADTDPDNLVSRRLLESFGFRLEGVLREEWETHLGVRDTTLYGLLRTEWLGRTA